MQYLGRAIGSVSKTWSSINPATLSGAIDVIVVEQEDGELACSPFHVRFGKFQLLRPSQNKVTFIVNDEVTDLPMKLGDGGEAFFVFQTEGYIPPDLQTSPVLSPESSPSGSPRNTEELESPLQEPEYLDISASANDKGDSIFPMDSIPQPSSSSSSFSSPPPPKSHETTADRRSSSPIRSTTANSASSISRAQAISKKLIKKNIPSKVDVNGDVLLDMQGYKSNSKDVKDTNDVLKQLLKDEFGEDADLDTLINTDLDGTIRISAEDSLLNIDPESTIIQPQSPGSITSTTSSSVLSDIKTDTDDTSTSSTKDQQNNYFKTLRLTSEQLKCLSLNYGENDIKFSVNNGKALIVAKLFLWKYDTPIVISDIDGTITKSDALGHVLTMLGRDWTHVGVAKLFSDIEANGYNIMYLTARSVGLADTTRSYLAGVEQDGLKLPAGPVILSPDRTIAALRREIVLKKPEVFKMACLTDIKALYDGSINHTVKDDLPIADQSSSEPTKIREHHVGIKSLLSADNPNTPFYAGFGNRITDALSYRTVGIPASRIFTINPDGEVHMELLEMTGYKSSYVSIGELVDQFFPPATRSLNGQSDGRNFTDATFWREPVLNIDDLSEDDSEEEELRRQKALAIPGSPATSPSSPRLSFFSRSPPPSSPKSEMSMIKEDVNEKDIKTLATNGNTIFDDDEDYDEDLDPDFIDDNEYYEDDYEDDDYEDEEDFYENDEEDLDGDLLDDIDDSFADDNTNSPISQRNVSVSGTPSKSPSVGMGIGLAGTTRSRSSTTGIDQQQVNGTFIKARDMLNALKLEEEK